MVRHDVCPCPPWCCQIPWRLLHWDRWDLAFSSNHVAEMMEYDVWTLKLNWMSQVWFHGGLFPGLCFFCDSDEMMSIMGPCVLFARPATLQGSRWKELWQMLPCSICHSSLHRLAQGSQKGAGFSPPARWGLLDFMSVASSSSSASCLLLLVLLLLHCDPCQCALPDLNHDHPRHAQCSLPDLNHDHPRPEFPAGPQPRPSAPSVPCQTSTASIHAKCSLPDLM